MNVKRQLFICIISDTFPRGFAQKVQFLGGGLLKCLNLGNHAVDCIIASDLDSRDAGLSKTSHVFELQPAVH